MKQNKIIIGWQEWLKLPGLDMQAMIPTVNTTQGRSINIPMAQL